MAGMLGIEELEESERASLTRDWQNWKKRKNSGRRVDTDSSDFEMILVTRLGMML